MDANDPYRYAPNGLTVVKVYILTHYTQSKIVPLIKLVILIIRSFSIDTIDDNDNGQNGVISLEESRGDS